MDKFCQITSELLPLIRVENGFSALSHTFFGRLPSNVVGELIFKRSDLGLKMDKFVKLAQSYCP